MPSRKRGTGQASGGAGSKKFRHDVARLKSLGLVSKRVDARKQRETKYMKSQVRKFSDVLEGRAQVVKAPRSVVKQYSDAYRTKGGRVVVPTEKNEKAFYSTKTQRIAASRPGYSDGERIIKEFTKQGDEIPRLPPGHVFTIPLGSGYQSFDTFSDAVLFMAPYESGPHKYSGKLGDWRKYLVIERREYADGDF